MHKTSIGLALGSGSSRGWSHIGVLNALAEQGIVPDVICGASIGALVGASYVSSNLEKLERWVRSLTKFETVRFFEFNTSFNGFVNKERFHRFLNEHVAGDDALIEKLPRRFAAVATDLEAGREVWMTEGSVLEAVWSSIAMPGLFPPIRNRDRWLVDGGLVNPVPVSMCRALGADVVIAVNLNGDLLGRHLRKPNEDGARRSAAKGRAQGESAAKTSPGVVGKFTDLVAEYAASAFPARKDNGARPPGLFDAIASSFNIAQDRITKSRMAGDPPDILLTPKLAQIGLLEFYRAAEAITEGERCVRRMLPEIRYVLDMGEP